MYISTGYTATVMTQYTHHKRAKAYLCAVIYVFRLRGVLRLTWPLLLGDQLLHCHILCREPSEERGVCVCVCVCVCGMHFVVWWFVIGVMRVCGVRVRLYRLDR